uniref:ATP synthase F0 subunit 8 n=1 Tax=Alloxysta sp. ZJUH_2016001 TaxID=2491149 RepID=A0A3S8V076_9HYME|nr:ATP synthase F0 subunit 8 [Alloxysta sp. ZJUH_2016001]
MPQMKPLNWLLLTLYFLLMYLLINNLIYFYKFFKNNQIFMNKNLYKYKFKW